MTTNKFKFLLFYIDIFFWFYRYNLSVSISFILKLNKFER